LQSAKCTYYGIRAISHRKSGRDLHLIFSKKIPNCAPRSAFRDDFQPSRQFRRAQEVSEISPRWAQNGPLSQVGELLAFVPWHGHLAREVPTPRAGSRAVPDARHGPRLTWSTPRVYRAFRIGVVGIGPADDRTPPTAAGLRRNRVPDGRNPAGCRPGKVAHGPSLTPNVARSPTDSNRPGDLAPGLSRLKDSKWSRAMELDVPLPLGTDSASAGTLRGVPTTMYNSINAAGAPARGEARRLP
jgi:hypothetical protein